MVGLEKNQQVFCSKLGVELLTNLLLKTSKRRMHLCRDLFILLKFMSTVACKVRIIIVLLLIFKKQLYPKHCTYPVKMLNNDIYDKNTPDQND